MTTEELNQLFTTAKAEKDAFAKFVNQLNSVAKRIEELKGLTAEDIAGKMPILKADYEWLCNSASNVLAVEKFALVEQVTAFSIANSQALAEKKAIQDLITGL